MGPRGMRRSLLLLAAALSLSSTHSLFSPESLKCLCDFNTTISCVWNGSRLDQHSDSSAATASCSLRTFMIPHPRSKIKAMFSSTCNLRPLDPAQPALRACSLVSPPPTSQVFRHGVAWNISLVCESVNSLTIIYYPAHNIKLNPPRRPEVNMSTVSLLSEVPRMNRVDERHIQLQWKQHDQPWEDGKVENQSGLCNPLCQVELTPLEQGRRYQARSRVQPLESNFWSVWSDWSPTLTWVSPIGTELSTPEREVGTQWEALVTAAVGAMVVLSLAAVACRTDTWVFFVKKIRGPPLPNLDKFLKDNDKSQVWLKTGYPTIESHHTFSGLEVISPVEVINCWSAPLQNLKASSSYSNPSYPPSHPHLPDLSTFLPLPQGNLEPCRADSPYGPVGGEESAGEPEENQGEDRGGRALLELELLSLIFGAHTSTAGSMAVCPDYEKVGNVRAQGSSEPRIPDPDVGHDEEEERDSWDGCRDGGEGGRGPTEDGPQGSERQEEEEADDGSQIQKSSSEGAAHGAILGQGTLEVCLDHEKVEPQVSLDVSEKLKLLQNRAQSPDSGVGSVGEEEQVSQDSLEEGDFSPGTNTFTFPALCDAELRLQSSFVRTPFLPWQARSSAFIFSSGDGPPLTSTSTLLPSSGGYMPL